MKVNPEIANVINVVSKDKEARDQKKIEDERKLGGMADVVTVENKQASRSKVENVEQAKQVLDDVTKRLGESSAGLYHLNSSRVSKLIS
jgi:hydroxylamine reductase (hybrid-cluster protein)